MILNRNTCTLQWYPLLIVSILLFQCAAIQEFANIQKPELSIERVDISDFTFESVSLRFNVRIYNPNPISATLAGFDYDFKINDASFVKGQQSKQVVLEGLGESFLEIPVTLNFKELYKTYTSLQGNDSSSYDLACGFSFDLPVVGETQIPVSKSGSLPLVKIPSINLSGLKLNRVSLTGADLDLSIQVANPNAFDLSVLSLFYELSINGLSWGKGNIAAPLHIAQKNTNLLTIPISLNFAHMGRTIYQLITGNQALDYQLSGSLDLQSSLRIVQMTTIPFAGAGQLRILK